MTLRLHHGDADFASRFESFATARREADDDVRSDVAAILAQVRHEGDAALRALTQRFDGFDLDGEGWQIAPEQCADAYARLPADLRQALTIAAQRISAFHARSRPADDQWTDDAGVELGYRWAAVDAAGIYVPGGRAAYPSSVLMNAIPARVAGVERLVMVTPTPRGALNDAVLAAAHVAGITEIWRIGGAQAIAALAYGTHNIAPVDVVTGPGNAWVAEAKRQLYGVVGIDMVAGPSEIVVLADSANDPDWIAADLLSQAEHDPTSQSVLFTDDVPFAERVAAAVEARLAGLATREVAEESWRDNGAIIVMPTLDAAMPLVNQLAAEHLELAVGAERARALFAMVRHAGSVFLGRMTPEAMGDYLAGPNHVLPTGRRARFSSGLSVTDFMKRTSHIALSAGSMQLLGPHAATLADAEGLPAHAASVRIRL